MKKILIPAIVCGIAIAFGVWWYSPAQVVKRRTVKLLETLTFAPGAGAASRQMGGYSLNSLLAENVELDTPTIPEANGSFNRADLESAYSWLGSSARRTEFKVEEIHSVTVDGGTATVQLTLDGLVELSSGSPVDGLFDVNFEWQRADDGWRLAKAKWRNAK